MLHIRPTSAIPQYYVLVAINLALMQAQRFPNAPVVLVELAEQHRLCPPSCILATQETTALQQDEYHHHPSVDATFVHILWF
ncbi:hypothetical protein LSAT2_008217, partial [Lamellibrachia satsuma]